MSGFRIADRIPETIGTIVSGPDHSQCHWMRNVLMLAATAIIAVPGAASAQSFWGWDHSPGYSEHTASIAPRRTPKPKKKHDPAEARAKAAAKPQGPLVIAVSITNQHVKVYDSNGLFAESAVSTGTRSHPTPAGVFSVIQKNRHHVSNLYYAQMPYMQRITWSGVAMHTGALPGYAASHGCIRLPNEFAARLWTWTRMGTRVIVSHGDISPADITHAKLVARMAPVQNVSALPALGTSASLTADKRDARAQIRTADAADAIARIEGKLSDASRAAPADKPMPESDKAFSRPSELKSVGIDAAGDIPADKPVEATATVVTPAPAAPVEKSASMTAASKPVEPETTAKPADIVAPVGGRRDNVVVPIAPAEAVKPVVGARPRQNNHVSVFISRKDRKLYVRQGFEPVFDTPVEITDIDRPLGTHVFTARTANTDTQALTWSVVSIPQSSRVAAQAKTASRKQAKAPVVAEPAATTPSASEALDRIAIPVDAHERIATIIAPGGSVLISDHGLGWETGRGTDFIVPIR